MTRDDERQPDLPRWFWVINDIGTIYVPLVAVGLGLLLHAAGWTTAFPVSRNQQLNIGLIIGLGGLGFALLTWAVLGAIAFVRDTWGNPNSKHGRNR